MRAQTPQCLAALRVSHRLNRTLWSVLTKVSQYKLIHPMMLISLSPLQSLGDYTFQLYSAPGTWSSHGCLCLTFFSYCHQMTFEHQQQAYFFLTAGNFYQLYSRTAYHATVMGIRSKVIKTPLTCLYSLVQNIIALKKSRRPGPVGHHPCIHFINTFSSPPPPPGV